MIVPILIGVGIVGSLASMTWLPIIGALAISVIMHEYMMYDLHRHLSENDNAY